MSLTSLHLLAQQPAPGPGGPGGGGLMTLVIYMALFFGAMYFFIIAPQRKRQKEHAKLIEELKAGDEVMTNGGIIGTILAVKNDRISIRTADDTKLEVSKSFVQNRLSDKK